MLKIPVERALERARICQPPDNEIIELRCLPDGQWIALYMQDTPPVKDFERTCYKMLECSLFNSSEL